VKGSEGEKEAKDGLGLKHKEGEITMTLRMMILCFPNVMVNGFWIDDTLLERMSGLNEELSAAFEMIKKQKG
jgi:hypothetical protein